MILPEDSEFCQYCGTKIEEEGQSQLSCTKCGNALTDDSDFCQYCGTPVGKKTVLPQTRSPEMDKIFPEKSKIKKKVNAKKPLKIATIVLAIAFAIVAGLSVYQYFAVKDTIASYRNSVDSLRTENSKFDSTIKSQNETITNQNGTIYDLKRTLSFYEQHAVVVPDDGTNLYHTYGCDYLDTSSFWIYNTEAAIDEGFKPCPHCQN
jgi:RNA polymerase subunit RPABC4/transcription elongation factor Spt4